MHEAIQRLEQARPRLLRYAQKYSLLFENAEDIVQETLLEAWRHLEDLRAPEHLESWLMGICHNVCLRWNHRYLARESKIMQTDTISDLVPLTTRGTQIDFDPTEDLERRDLAVFLDRALKHLAPETQTALELFYIEELAQEEIAARLGMTIGALKVRLYRARKQLWKILQQELREEAETFGLLINSEERSWQRTSIWCYACGQEHALGRFGVSADGRRFLQLRCTQCEQQLGKDKSGLLNSEGEVSLGELHSFRVAFKHCRREIPPVARQMLTQREGPCICGKGSMRFCGIEQRELPMYETRQLLPVSVVVLACTCTSATSPRVEHPAAFLVDHPAIFQFMEKYPRSIMGTSSFVQYQGSQALGVDFVDVANEKKLHIFLHPETLLALGYEEN